MSRLPNSLIGTGTFRRHKHFSCEFHCIVFSGCSYVTNDDLDRYFSLFVIYTPYTIYQCTFLFNFCVSSQDVVDCSVLFCFADGWKGWGNLLYRDSWKCESQPSITDWGGNMVYQTDPSLPDIILAACDVEGNFLVVKVNTMNSE